MLRTQIINYLKSVDPSLPVDERYVFGYYDGLRLTYEGYMLLSKNFEHHTFDLSKEFKLTAEKILKINKLEKPYFYNKKIMVLFGQEDYLSLSLMSDIDLWINSIT